MKIVLYGATGMIGSSILREALSRGHEVTAVARDTSKLTPADHMTAVKGDVLDTAGVAATVKGHDAVISAINAPPEDPQVFVRAAQSLIAGLTQAGVKRLISVGGAGSLEVAPGVKLFDTPEFPDLWRPGAKALGGALEVYRTADLDWTFISPAGIIAPGERTGKFRVGGDQLLTDVNGESKISVDDYAIGLVDELEQAKHLRQRITLAY
ncbi:MAG: NAD(P)H-binding protein [Chloroflexi bacterium]|nr:NAD(P)H-binding protein [Chloroflexota bacterium]